MAKPFLRWAGSKQQLVKSLASYWPGGDTRYVEPFAGSARLFFEIEPRSAILGDINAGLIEMYKIVRDHPVKLHAALKNWANDEKQYYRVRAKDPGVLDNMQRAARFVYLNRFCFNGLYRTNEKGQFNVPYGGAKSGRLPSLAELESASALLSRAKLVSADFARVLRHVAKGDFGYLDPPYSVQSRRVFREYDPASFGPSDLKRMRSTLKKLNKLGVSFLLSYADSAEGEALAVGFRSTRVKTRRHIAGFTGNRRVANELVITNTAPI